MPELAINGGSPVRTEPYMTWPPVLDEEIEAVNRVLREGQMGRITRFRQTAGRTRPIRFREAWKQYYPGKEFAIPCGSCCDALELALRNAGDRPGRRGHYAGGHVGGVEPGAVPRSAPTSCSPT